MRMPVFRRTKTKRWLVILSGLLLSSILFAACGEQSPSILDTAGPVADNEKTLFWVIIIVATVVFLGVEGALIYSISRFRDRPGRPNPQQLHGDLRLELIMTAIPALFLLIILGFTIRGLIQVSPEAEPAASADHPKIKVIAIGHQWWWEFYYPEWKFNTADSMHIPVGATVHVDLYSNNVIHSFWVPNLTGKTDLVPGHSNTKWFIADKSGTYEGICAEFCGAQHANMRFNVIAENNDTFQTWVSTQQQAATTPAPSNDKHSAAQGLSVFQNACTSCHGIVGVNNVTAYADTKRDCDKNPDRDPKGACLLGPNLTHFGSRGLIAGGVLTNNIEACQDPNDPKLYENCNLAKWLRDPQGIKPGNDMNVQLNDDQIRALVAYLENLK